MRSYFTKLLPQRPLYLSNGEKLQVEAINDKIGVIATEVAYIISELEAAINEERGGVALIDEATYNSLIAQKGPTTSFPQGRFQRQHREEIGPSRTASLGEVAAKPAAGANQPAPKPAPAPEPLRVPSPDTFKPKAVKRSSVKKKGDE